MSKGAKRSQPSVHSLRHHTVTNEEAKLVVTAMRST
jgi:hypothetical protein